MELSNLSVRKYRRFQVTNFTWLNDLKYPNIFLYFCVVLNGSKHLLSSKFMEFSVTIQISTEFMISAIQFNFLISMLKKWIEKNGLYPTFFVIMYTMNQLYFDNQDILLKQYSLVKFKFLHNGQIFFIKIVILRRLRPIRDMFLNINQMS